MVAGCTVQVAAVRKKNYLFFSEKPLQRLAKLCNGLQYLNPPGFCHRGAEAPSGSAGRRGTPGNDSSDQRMVTPAFVPQSGTTEDRSSPTSKRYVKEHDALLARRPAIPPCGMASNGHITMTFSKPIVSDYRYFLNEKLRMQNVEVAD